MPPVAAVEAVAAVLYVEGDELPEGKAVGDVKTAAVEAVEAVAAVAAVEAVTAVEAVAANKEDTEEKEDNEEKADTNGMISKSIWREKFTKSELQRICGVFYQGNMAADANDAFINFIQLPPDQLNAHIEQTKHRMILKLATSVCL